MTWKSVKTASYIVARLHVGRLVGGLQVKRTRLLAYVTYYAPAGNALLQVGLTEMKMAAGKDLTGSWMRVCVCMGWRRLYVRGLCMCMCAWGVKWRRLTYQLVAQREDSSRACNKKERKNKPATPS